MSKADDIVSRANHKKHASNMADAILPHDIELLRISWGEAQKQFPAIGSFNLKNPRVKDTISQLATRITGMADTTKSDIRGILETALTGEGKIPSTDEIAKLIRESGATNSVSRSKTIARTESQKAFNEGAFLSYEAADIEKVECLDSDNDEECAARNGKIFTLAEARDVDPHPNCVIAWAAVVE
jgi:hypothetical protein